MNRAVRQHRRKAALWILLVLNMAVVFALSARTAEESTAASDAVLAAPKEVYDTLHPETAEDERVYWWFQFIVRKTAHLLEFASLGVWAVGLSVLYRLPLPFAFGVGFSALYALSDELHQLLVPGRKCRITDWLIDCLGAILGAALVWFIQKKLNGRMKRAKSSLEQ